MRNIVIAAAFAAAFVGAQAAEEAWFGAKIPGSGEKPGVEDCGMTAAKVFDAPIAGLERIGSLAVPKSSEVPESSSASIGFEGLDRGLFEPGPTYDKLAATGVKWARVQTMWSRCEKQKGVYDFSVLDGIVDSLTKRGLRPWFTVTFGNTLYMTNCYTGAAGGCVPTLYGDECREAWCAFVRELAKRYKGKVTHWEIWNEPNLPQFWQPTKPNAAQYLELVKLTGGIIRNEIPDAKIGGTTSSPAIGGWERAFFDLGGAKHIDFWCGHAYGCVPERLRHHQKIADESTDDYVAVLRDMRRFVDSKGGSHVEIWQGESGFPSWFPESHWLYPKGVCKEGWQSQANQAKWMLRRYLTDRRAGLARSSFYQTADISRHYSMANSTQKHPAEHGILNGWTYEPKMSYYAFGNYNALFATASYDASAEVSLAVPSDAGAPTVAAAFRMADDSPLFVYYAAFDFSLSYVGKCYKARKDAVLTVPSALAPKDSVLVDMLRGGVYAVSSRKADGDTVAFSGLPLVDYPLVLADRSQVKLADGVCAGPVPSGCPEFEVEMPRPRAGAVVKAADFGLSEANLHNDVAINAAIAEAKRIGAARVELAPGTYRCFDGGGLRIADFEDFTFDGKGATLVFRRDHAPMESQSELLEGEANVEIKNCRRSVVENFNVDWDWENDPLGFWCVAVDKHLDEKVDNASYVDFELDKPHPKYGKQVPIQLINPMAASKAGPRLEPRRGPRAFCGQILGHMGAKSEWLSPTRLRVWPHVKPASGHLAKLMERHYSPKQNRTFVKLADIGGTFSIAHHYYGMNGVVMDSNRHLTLRNVDVWGCWGMGFEVRGAQQYWQLVDANVRSRPGERYPVTSTADAYHIVQSMGFGKMVGCELTMNQDDFINIHDRTQVAQRRSARTLEVVNTRGVAYTMFRAGSLVGLKYEDFSDSGWTGRIEKIDGETITVDRDLPEQKGLVFVLVDRAFKTENFLFSNCRFHDSAGSRCVVQGNNITFDGCTFGPMKGLPLKFSSCYSYNVWCEGIGCTNIVVRNCRFENCLDEGGAKEFQTVIYAGLSIPPDGYMPQAGIEIANAAFAAEVAADRAAGRKVAPSPHGVCDILVENCTFLNPRSYVFYAKNGCGFTLRGNKVEWCDPPCSKVPASGVVHIEGKPDYSL